MKRNSFKILLATMLLFYSVFWGVSIELIRNTTAAMNYIDPGFAFPLPGEFIIYGLSSPTPFTKYCTYLEIFLTIYMVFLIILFICSNSGRIKTYILSGCFFMFQSVLGLFFIMILLLCHYRFFERLDPPNQASSIGYGIHFIFIALFVSIILIAGYKFFRRSARIQDEKSL
jgi:hypothetical protein